MKCKSTVCEKKHLTNFVGLCKLLFRATNWKYLKVVQLRRNYHSLNNKAFENCFCSRCTLLMGLMFSSSWIERIWTTMLEKKIILRSVDHCVERKFRISTSQGLLLSLLCARLTYEKLRPLPCRKSLSQKTVLGN